MRFVPVPFLVARFHDDAVHRAGVHAEAAAGAFVADDGVHFLVAAEDGVNRAGFDAFGAADAPVFDDKRHLWRGLCAVFGVERLGLNAEQFGEFFDAFLAAGRAAVDVRLAFGDGFGVGFAAGEAALAALGLRQDGVDFFDERVAFDFVFLREVAEQQAAEGERCRAAGAGRR